MNKLNNKKDPSALTDESCTIKSASFNDNMIIPQKTYFNSSKNKFRNFTETFTNYSENEFKVVSTNL